MKRIKPTGKKNLVPPVHAKKCGKLRKEVGGKKAGLCIVSWPGAERPNGKKGGEIYYDLGIWQDFSTRRVDTPTWPLPEKEREKRSEGVISFKKGGIESKRRGRLGNGGIQRSPFWVSTKQ